MAYTYDDFVSAANKAGMMSKFSQQDLVTAQKSPEFGLSMLSLMKDIDGSTTEEQRLLATEAANQLRKTYGNYTLGDSGNSTYVSSYGSQINDVMDQVSSYGDFTYGNESIYQQLLDKVANRQEFSYDAETDPRFSAYKKEYLREGDRASANAIAQASAGTGGVPSSFAATAAAQVGNYYAGQLADIIPTLYADSYDQYVNDFNMDLSGLGALQTDKQTDYEEYLNRYNMLQNKLGNLQTQEGTEYNRYLDAWNQAMQREQAAQSAEQQKWQNAMTLYNALGYMTPEMEQILLNKEPEIQITTDQIKALQRVLGVTADGSYGPISQNAAGGLTAAEAYEKYVTNGEAVPRYSSGGSYSGRSSGGNGGTGVSGDIGGNNPASGTPTYGSILDECNMLIRNGASKSTVGTHLREEYQMGHITQAEYNQLKNQFVPKGSTY